MRRCSPEVCALEALLKERRRISNILLNLDMYERWGRGSDPKLDAELARDHEYQAERKRLTRAIETKLANLDPELVKQWAGAHIALLSNYIDRIEGEPEKNDTELFVAREERDGWEDVRRTGSGFVDPNIFYVSYDPDLYRELFDLEY